MIQDAVNFFEANKVTFAVCFAWLVREFWTIGAAGGLVGLYRYFVFGIKPAVPAQPEKPLPLINSDLTTTPPSNPQK
jgi:hypothetical protein